MEKAVGEVKPSRYRGAMSKDDPERERRLAEALRANLRRRKAQAREVAAETEVPSMDGGDGDQRRPG